MDLIRPARFDQPIDRGLNDDVSQVKPVEDAGVEDGNRRLKRHSAAAFRSASTTPCTEKAMKGIVGKRLMYRRSNETKVS
jgi:hypothetical protein